MKYILGIETTAHTFGASVMEIKNPRKKSLEKKDFRILSNVRDSYTTKQGGIIPFKLVEHHVDVFDRVIVEALEKARVSLKKIDMIAVSNAPGQGHALKVGVLAARLLSKKAKIPIVGVNHCIAHLEIGRALTKANDPILLYASGANTQIIAYDAGKYRIFGETLDVGIGHFLDVFGRELGLGFPAGPKIDQLAKKGKKYIELPYNVKGMDITLGGILTNLKQKIKSGKYSKADLCYSAQETVFAMLLEVSERALAHCDKKELLLGGGVACNSRLQEMSEIMCRERKAKCFILDLEYNIDNAAMIAVTGYLMYKNASVSKRKDFVPEKIDVLPYQRTDDVKVWWR